MVTTPSRTCSAPEMQPRTHSGSLQWRHATAKLMPPGPSSIRMFGCTAAPLSAFTMSLLPELANAQ